VVAEAITCKFNSDFGALWMLAAQGPGQAISGAIDSAIADGFANDGALLEPSASGLHFNFSADPDDERCTDDASVAGPDTHGSLVGAQRLWLDQRCE
jgi:hypothetical protein